jgi:hypothetical protein
VAGVATAYIRLKWQSSNCHKRADDDRIRKKAPVKDMADRSKRLE